MVLEKKWLFSIGNGAENRPLEKGRNALIRAGVQRKVQVGMCLRRRFRSVCTSAQSDQSLSFLSEETLNL